MKSVPADPVPSSGSDADNTRDLAAVDLGSNSFHMIIARVEADGQLQILDKLRESVRLGAGLTPQGDLTPEARERALACLERFGERLRHFPSADVGVVGTNTLRQASKARDFIDKAEAAIGHPISVINGREEARLIYLGVAHSLAQDTPDEKRFVMDIGGGSTELIIGQGFETLQLESLHMGCVSSSQRFFVGGKLDKKRWKKALTAAHLDLMPIQRAYRDIGWQSATGASGTIKAVHKVIQQSGLAPYGITLANMRKVQKLMMEAGHIDKLKLAGLSDERRPVFAGGLAVLIATFEALDIEQMHVSDGALREGVIYDRLNRYQQQDVRGKAVLDLQKRFVIDQAHADQVKDSAVKLFHRCRDAWGLPPAFAELVAWAADLHEIGLAVSHSGYQKHGAYLLANTDLAGFSNEERNWLSVLVRTHRRKLSRKLFDDLLERDYKMARYLSVLLRLSVLLNRSRNTDAPPISRVTAGKHGLLLAFEDEALREKRPLLFADLAEEQKYLKALDFTLEF